MIKTSLDFIKNFSDLVRRRYISFRFIVGETHMIFEYFPSTGTIGFCTEEAKNKGLELTNEGAFKTMQSLIEIIKLWEIKKICYASAGKTRREADIKDRLYQRTAIRNGFELECVRGKIHYSYLEGSFIGPVRYYSLREN